MPKSSINPLTSPLVRIACHVAGWLLAGVGLPAMSATAAFNDPPNLSAVPPDLSQAVDPNVILTFDDSGSMSNTYMGDQRPYGGTGWNGPWACANVIDPRATLPSDPKSKGMNGVYYNPNVTYAPPLKEDGSPFPNADATLKAVWADGISVNRPVSPLTAGAIGFNDNPSGVASGSNALSHLLGGYLKQTGAGATCTGQPGNCTCSGSGSSKVCITDNRWHCANPSSWSVGRGSANPFDGTVVDPGSGTKPNGAPVYWRLKSTVTFVPGTDIGALGQFTASGLSKLYVAGNWEAVAVPPSQYQNFANWYAYYRYRNAMARTVISRVFAVIGTTKSAGVRVLWQNLNVAAFGGGPASLTGLNGKRINSLDDNSPDPFGSAAPYRRAFFNWIYQVPAAGSTPARTAAIRAGNFVCNGLAGNANCNPNSSPATKNDTNPFWSGGTPGQELACRQNFHIMMTDGYYNTPVVSVVGNASSTSNATAALGPVPPSYPATNPTTYATGTGPTLLFGHKGWAKDVDGGSSYSDIGFYFWANNLRPDFITSYPKDSVPAYFPDQTTGVTAAPSTVNPADPGATPEVFWNPLNDPATWPHIVQFAVALGASGNLTLSNDIDCNLDDGFGVGNDDLCKLRTGKPTSTGSTTWGQPNGIGGAASPANIDDLWHAALNSRGAFFVASNPNSLVQHLTDILSSISSRSQSSTSAAVSASILNSTTVAYTGGYDSGSWSGYLYQLALDPATAIATAANWDAGCLLTGGTFVPIAPTSSTQPRGSCLVSASPVTPVRRIFTAIKSGGSLVGRPFVWTGLGATEQGLLHLDPDTIDPNTSTGQVTGTSDGNGTDRLDYLRGKRANETMLTSHPMPRQFRPRQSVLGPVVNSQVLYEAGPSSGLSDVYPPNSPEELAARPCLGAGGLSASGCNSYEKFLNTYLSRPPTLYVGANDGMLHAFDASSGVERWAYVPNMLYGNGQLTQMTNPKSTLTPTVDDTPIVADMFLSGQWRTILIGSMRLGGRGIYALDVTDSSTPASDAAAAAKFKWEFTSENDPDLGYTYASTNTARLANGKWAVLVSSGYFPQRLQVRSATYGSPPSFGAPVTAPAATADVSHLWVLDADTGAVIAKINTPSGITSYGLSTPGVVDFGLDLIDDIAVAGDLAGNLWRFDLSSPSPAGWKVEVLFQSYSSASPCSATTPQGIGCEPIAVQPIAFPDRLTGGVIYVFGSGEYLGPDDKDASKVFTPQHVFGVRDYGTGSSKYPLHESDLVTHTLTQTGSQRFVSASPIPANKSGWQIPLNVPGIAGERDVVAASPIYSLGAAVVTTLIPGANNNLCTPGRVGSVIALDAATGGAVGTPAASGSAPAYAGVQVLSPPTTGGVSALGQVGGGYFIPGIGDIASPNAGNSALTLNFGVLWRRNSWRELLNNP